MARSTIKRREKHAPLYLVISTAMLVACGSDDNSSSSSKTADLPQLSAAEGVNYGGNCSSLLGTLSFENTSISSVTTVAAGELSVGDTSIDEHCLVSGTMNERTSDVDGKSYAIGFEMRLPKDWNGRFFYQANGGNDGSVVTATGGYGGAPDVNALSMGFAVISSDAGHSAEQEFGYDPQARLDYGYQAVGFLTPMAKSIIRQVYNKAPDRSYIGGCSNGGRHTLVAAKRYVDEYDGYLASAPGYRLPRATTARLGWVQAYASIDGTNPVNLSTAFNATERLMVANAVLAQCDSLDGAEDGMVQDFQACQTTFNLQDDVPTCSSERDGTCLTQQQKDVISSIYEGVKTSSGKAIYSPFPYDPAMGGGDSAFWQYQAAYRFESSSTAMIFTSPPVELQEFNPANFNAMEYALTTDLDDILTKTEATTDLYAESAMSFMTPPNPEDMSVLKNRGAKIMVFHGINDQAFSVDDTAAWYESLEQGTGDTEQFARFYAVPGMGHCKGGQSTDQFDMLSTLIAWVEQGEAPESIVANVRGNGNPVGVNADLPASWSADRSRPLCPYPKVARYNGSGDIEDAANFSCAE